MQARLHVLRNICYRCPFCVSNRTVSVGTGDRTGHESVLGQAIIHSIPEVFPWCWYWYRGPTFPPLFSLTHQLSIYPVPSMHPVPFWRAADGQGLVSPVGGLEARILPQWMLMWRVLCSFQGCYRNHQLAPLSAK